MDFSSPLGLVAVARVAGGVAVGKVDVDGAVAGIDATVVGWVP